MTSSNYDGFDDINSYMGYEDIMTQRFTTFLNTAPKPRVFDVPATSSYRDPYSRSRIGRGIEWGGDGNSLTAGKWNGGIEICNDSITQSQTRPQFQRNVVNIADMKKCTNFDTLKKQLCKQRWTIN